TRAQLFERIAHTVWATDDLMRDYACLPLSLLAERAAQDLKVVFSGEGGDEAFAGYRRYADSVEGWLKALAFGTGGFRTHGEWGRRRETRAALSGALRAVDTRLPFRTHWAETPPDWSRMQQRQYVDLKTALPDNLLVKADRILMAFGLEGRVPFCDHRLVAFGLSLPDAVKYRQRRGKYLIRRWAEKVLPKDHLQRPKRGFYVPVPEWISGRFLDQLELVLLADRAVREWFDPIACRRLFDRQRSKGGCTRAIWGLMQFAIWHRFMVEQPGLQPAVCENPLDVIRG
nr:asparagine synthase C-terminal domain-containing protein [Thiolinea sp.]